jgi:transcriptional regulator with XRE-family HTH domain
MAKIKRFKLKTKKTLKQNRLWLARKKLGLGQKQVAYLLNLKTADQVSRYEKRMRVPTLETALKLEIVYGLPLRILFKDLFDELQRDISQRAQKNTAIKHLYGKVSTTEMTKVLGEFCSYTESLNSASISGRDKARIRDHITYLAKKLAYL